MGFLSRKKKNLEPVVTEGTHPLEEELARMEEAVPERPVNDYVEAEYPDQGEYLVSEYEEGGSGDDFDEGAPTAGPVADERTSSSQAAGEVHPSAPPAEDELAAVPRRRPLRRLPLLPRHRWKLLLGRPSTTTMSPGTGG